MNNRSRRREATATTAILSVSLCALALVSGCSENNKGTTSTVVATTAPTDVPATVPPVVPPVTTTTVSTTPATRTPTSTATATATATVTRTATPTTANLTPQQLYDKLLAGPFTASALPSGFSNARTQKGEPTDTSKKYNVIGDVDVPVTGPDDSDAIFYSVYQTNADAVARNGERQPGQSTQLSGVTGPSKCYAVSSTSGSTPAGYSFCAVVVDNVEILTSSQINGANRSQGNPQNAEALARAAITHLTAVRGGSAPSASPTRTGTTAPVLRSPQSLYDTLLTSTWNQAELPPGFSSPAPSKGNPSESAKRNNVLGDVDVEFGGPDKLDVISFSVYNNAADAKAKVDASTVATTQISGVNYPSRCTTTPYESGAISTCSVLVDNVEVLSIIQTATPAGNLPTAQAAARAGVAQLLKVRTQ